jgi:hypothetical protein
MAKKLAIALAVLMLAIVAWGLFLESNIVTIVINGQPVTGPLKDAIGMGGLIVALIALFCAATLLVFVFAGIGVIVLGCFVIVGVIMAALSFPFLLPLLIPLAILWGSSPSRGERTRHNRQVYSPKVSSLSSQLFKDMFRYQKASDFLP